MKKLLILTSLVFCLALDLSAQSYAAYNQGDKIVQVGLGLGRAIGGNYLYAYSGLGASINGALEIGVHEYFSVGPYAAFGRYSLGLEDFNLTAIAAGARGSFHFTALFNEAFDTSINEEKLDLYVSLLLGLQFNSYNFDNEFVAFRNASRVTFDGGAVLGGRYKFNPSVAVFTELGYASLSIWTIGASFHF